MSSDPPEVDRAMSRARPSIDGRTAPRPAEPSAVRIARLADATRYTPRGFAEISIQPTQQ